MRELPRNNLPRIAVIGAGPAGIAASAVLSGAKIEHCVLEKAVFPRDKPCGDAVALNAFADLETYMPGLRTSLQENAHYHAIDRIRFFRTDMTRPITLSMTGQENEIGFTMPRTVMDNILVSHLDQRFAVFCQGVSVANIESKHGEVILQIKGDLPREVSFSLVIVCSGSGSALYRLFDAGRYRLSALRVLLDQNLCMDQQSADLFYTDQLLPHYAWTFPVAGGRTNVGLCGMNLSVNMAHYLRDFIARQSMHVGSSLSASQLEALRFSYQSIPVSARIAYPKLIANSIILAGDAGYLAHTFTGGGIATAIRSGIAAGKQAVAAARRRDFSRSALAGYADAIKGQMRAEQLLDFFLRRVFSSPMLLGMAFRMFSGKTFFSITHAFRPRNLLRLLFWRRVKTDIT